MTSASSSRRALTLLVPILLPFVAQASPAPRALSLVTRARIEALLREPSLQSAHVGVAVMALGEARSPAQARTVAYDGGAQPLLFGRDENKRFLPASNMKLFTAAWALDVLGPQTRLKTVVLSAPAQFLVDDSWPKTVALPLVVTLVGGGDPSFGFAGVDDLAAQIAKLRPSAVIVRAQNAPGGEELSAENGGNRYPDGWTLDDALWYYGAPVTGLSFERNQVDVTLTGTSPGQSARLEFAPAPITIAGSEGKPGDIIAPFNTFNLVTTLDPTGAATGAAPSANVADVPTAGVQWDRGDRLSPLGPALTLRGTLAPGQRVSEGVAIPDPREWARQQFAAALRRRDVPVIEPRNGFIIDEVAVSATHLSAPTGTLLKRFLKSSDNLYGEMLLRRAARALPTRVAAPTGGAPIDYQIASTGGGARAHNAMARWLRARGVSTRGLRFSDGSGLSRYNLVTPISVAQLLGAAQKARGAVEFYDALPIAGVDGTLKSRMKNTSAMGNARAKTGTFATANCLSGYVTTLDGHRLAVSILTNGAESGEVARQWQGRVFAALADSRFSAPRMMKPR